MSENVLVFAGETPESQSFATKVCDHLGVELSHCKIVRFNDDESQPQFEETVSNKICIIVCCLHQTPSRNSNDSMMVLFQMCRALFASQAERIIVLSPYTPMARQDKPDDKRSCIGAGLFADLLKASAKDTQVRFITFDLHAAQISTVLQVAGIRSDNLHSEPHMITYVKEYLMKKNDLTNDDIVVVAPDGGASKRAKRVAKDGTGLSCGHAHMDKTRAKAGVIASMSLVGEVVNKHAFIVDDMCDTGGTLCRAAEELIKHGALSVTVMVCHGVFSKDAIKKLTQCTAINLVVTTNTCDKSYPLEEPITVGPNEDIIFSVMTGNPKFHFIDISWLAAEAACRKVGTGSVSELFELKCTSAKQMEVARQEVLEKKKQKRRQREERLRKEGKTTPPNRLEKAFHQRFLEEQFKSLGQ